MKKVLILGVNGFIGHHSQPGWQTAGGVRRFSLGQARPLDHVAPAIHVGESAGVGRGDGVGERRRRRGGAAVR